VLLEYLNTVYFGENSYGIATADVLEGVLDRGTGARAQIDRPAFGGTYPAEIWARVMTVGLAGAPAPDVAPPDPGLWPEPTFVSEAGRGVAPLPGGDRPCGPPEKPKGKKK
jgi:hypothetical protein